MKSSFSNDFYLPIFANALDGIAFCEAIFDDRQRAVDWVYVKVSDNFESLTGLKDAEGKKASQLIPNLRASNPELYDIYGRVALGGPSERFETYVAPLSVWFQVSVYSPKRNYFVAVFENVTQQKQKDADIRKVSTAIQNVLDDLVEERRRLVEINAKDEALLKSIEQEKSRTLVLLRSIPDGVIATDLNGNVTHMNAAAEEMLRWSAKDALGRSFYDVVPLRDAEGPIPQHRRPLQIAVTTGRLSSTTLENAPQMIRSDHTAFPAHISAAPVVLGGDVIGGIVVFHDITREKELDRAKSEFISIASHQLRTPLSTMAWYSEALLAGHLGPLTEAQRKYMSEIAHMDARMIELVNALLSVSRIDLGTFKVVESLVNLPEVADAVLGELAKPIADRNIRVVKDYAGVRKSIVADPSIVHMVLQNLLSNAVMYNRQNGTISIRIVTNGEVHITVSDTGCGIPKKDQSSIFGKFFRADNAREIEPGGTGIGLYIIRSLLRSFGGSVWFESEEGKGSTFHALMPSQPSVPKDRPERSRRVESPTSPVPLPPPIVPPTKKIIRAKP